MGHEKVVKRENRNKLIETAIRSESTAQFLRPQMEESCGLIDNRTFHILDITVFGMGVAYFDQYSLM